MAIEEGRFPFFGPSGPPLHLYVHVPFCRSKCPYCAFYSVVPEAGAVEAYLVGLEAEISLRLREGVPFPSLSSVYFGGGTPSLLSPFQWERLFSLLEVFSLRPGAEVTVEANPESLTASHLHLWRARGVTRVSLGVQSLDDEELRILGRSHDSRRARDALGALAASGLSFSADLIFNIPGQTLRGWHRTVREILAFGMDHLSLYELTLEERSAWGRRPPDGMASGYPFYRWSQWYLASRGFLQYEIASFAFNRRWSRHNLAYWNRAPVLGLGPGAWGFLAERRYGNEDSLEEYLRKTGEGRLPLAVVEEPDQERDWREAAILALRTVWGISRSLFARRYGPVPLAMLLTVINDLPERFFRKTEDRIALSRRGMAVANAIWERIL